MAIQLPTAAEKSLMDITPQRLRAMGINAILLDIDNTLSHHNSHTPFDGAVEWTHEMRRQGFKLMIVSNNTKERVTPFSKQFDLPFVWRAVKPLPVGYLKACRLLKVKHRETVIIGDQVYTDIVGANFIGMKSILVEPAEHEHGWSFKVRRHFEKSVRQRIKKKGLYEKYKKGGATK